MLFVDADDPLGATETARQLSIPISTAFRLLTTLEAVGYLERGEGGTFRLGINAKEVGLTALNQYPVARAAAGTLKELATLTGQTVSLHVRVGDKVVRVAGRESASPVGAALRLGETRTCSDTPMGRLLLAHGPASARGGVSPRVLAALAKQRYVVTVDETPAHVTSLAWPILDSSGMASCVLALEGPEFQFEASESTFDQVALVSAGLERELQATPELAASPYDHLTADEIILPNDESRSAI
jgi:DNA-binding IclR family transcriptional regulator